MSLQILFPAVSQIVWPLQNIYGNDRLLRKKIECQGILYLY